MATQSGRIVRVDGGDGLAIVVKHDAGFTPVRLVRGADSVAVGDELWAHWATDGSGTVQTADGQWLDGTFGGTWPSLEAAIAHGWE
jgi:hypothetical protein